MKNYIYEILSQVEQYKISDIHIIENQPIFARMPSGQIKQISKQTISKDDIRQFLQDQLQPYKLEKILN
jgi:Tfp pilus assembly pilus retraction ATPase PilT